MTPTIRESATHDIERILPLVAEYYSEDGYPFDEAVVRAAFTRLIASPELGRSWVIVASEEDVEELVGYFVVTFGFSIEYGGRDAFADELFIRGDYRGRGLGTQALAIVERCCRENGVRALHLEVERDKGGAYALYRRSGFEDHDRHLMTKWLVDGE